MFKRLLLALVFLPGVVFAQSAVQRNDTPTVLYGSNLVTGNTVSVDSYGQQKVVVSDALTGYSTSSIPLSNSTGLSGPPTGTVGWTLVVADAVEAASTTTVLNLTAHVARVGDMIFSQTGTAANIRAWSTVEAVATNTVTLAQPLPATPTVADQVLIFRPVPISASGAPSGQSGAALMVNIDSGYQNATAGGILKTEDAAAGSGDAGIATFVKLQSALSVDAASGDYGTQKADLDGRAIAALAPAAETWQGCGTATAVTSDVAIKAAVASNRIYVTSITCKSTSATVATSLDFKDGTTVIAVGGIAQMAAASPGSYVATFPVPLRGTVNTAFNFATNVATTSVTCCAAGYIGVN